VLFKDKVNYKLPGGNGFRAHLDAPAYNHMGNIVHTNIMVTIDAQTTENGCLEVVPGSHKMDVPLVNNGQIDPDWEANHEWVKVPAEAGKKSVLFNILCWPDAKQDRRLSYFWVHYGTPIRPEFDEFPARGLFRDLQL
jgi:ectoine hydroxylase-related dioxygenase (phytanoyl-CoA dioxygenase family)